MNKNNNNVKSVSPLCLMWNKLGNTNKLSSSISGSFLMSFRLKLALASRLPAFFVLLVVRSSIVNIESKLLSNRNLVSFH